MRLMGERSSCLNFNQRASEWATLLCRHWGYGASLHNETMHTLLSFLSLFHSPEDTRRSVPPHTSCISVLTESSHV